MNRIRRLGVALILSLAVLAVLSILSVSFVSVTSTERDGSRNYLLQIKAQQVAQGGIERAVGELSRTVYKKSYTDFSNDPWIYRTGSGKLPGYFPVVPLDGAKYPSFAYDRDEDGTFENGVIAPSTSDLVNGRAVSGVIGDVGMGTQSTYGVAGGADYGGQFEVSDQVYVLKVRDAASKINVNSGQANLAVILDELGKSIAAELGYDPIAGKGAAIVGYRDSLPTKRCTDLEELLSVLDAKAIKHLREFLTCHAWTDPNTMRPDPSIDPAVMPKRVLEPRSPVNINTAPKPVLRALLVGLAGYELQFVETATVYLGSATVVDEKKLTTPLTFTQAGLIADEIMTARAATPFRTWDQFKTFVLGLSSVTGLTGLASGQLDVLRSNFNPNTLLARFNPNRVRAHSVDKMDLTRYSTELCFGSFGVFEIECLGLVTNNGGHVVARSRQLAVVRVARTLRHTTQREFQTGRIGSTNSTSYPENISNCKLNSDPLDDDGSAYDGQVEMFRSSTAGSSSFFSPFDSTLPATKAPGSVSPVWDTNPKEEKMSCFSGSDQLPDGMLSSRGMAEEIGYSTKSGNLPTAAGTIEFWVKLVGDGDTGSNESLFYSVITTKTGTYKEGIANKLLRWGDKLTNTRFYWGYPHYAYSKYPLATSAHSIKIGNWKAHEWHHIAIVYFDGVNQRFYVDGKKATDIISVSKSKMKVKLGSNNPGNEFTIGGYEFYSAQAVNIWNAGTVIVKGQNERFSNSTISGFKIYKSTSIYTGSSFAMDDKYTDNPITPSRWHGQFELTLPYGVRVGSLSWTEYQPKGWKTKTFNTSPTAPDTDVTVEYRIDGGAWVTVPATPKDGGDGRGYLVDVALGPAGGSTSRKLEYRFTFKNSGGIDPLTVTPVIDDVSFTYRIPPEFLFMRQVH